MVLYIDRMRSFVSIHVARTSRQGVNISFINENCRIIDIAMFS